MQKCHNHVHTGKLAIANPNTWEYSLMWWLLCLFLFQAADAILTKLNSVGWFIAQWNIIADCCVGAFVGESVIVISAETLAQNGHEGWWSGTGTIIDIIEHIHSKRYGSYVSMCELVCKYFWSGSGGIAESRIWSTKSGELQLSWILLWISIGSKYSKCWWIYCRIATFDSHVYQK